MSCFCFILWPVFCVCRRGGSGSHRCGRRAAAKARWWQRRGRKERSGKGWGQLGVEGNDGKPLGFVRGIGRAKKETWRAVFPGLWFGASYITRALKSSGQTTSSCLPINPKFKRNYTVPSLFISMLCISMGLRSSTKSRHLSSSQDSVAQICGSIS